MNNLKNARRLRGLTQRDLADKLNFDEMTIANYENLKTDPDIKTIIKICSILEVSADYLLGINNRNYVNLGSLEIEIELESMLSKIKKSRE